MGESHNKIFWHEAFFEAVQLELAEYRDILDFENEHQLSKEALKMDVLIIKKDKDAKIEKNIGRIFKGYNICEYKSETDSFSIFDYNKVNGYALLYSSFEHIDINNITITLAVTKHPRELFKYLKDGRGLEIIEMFNGVYYVTGDVIPVQILESKRLSEDDNLFLKSLRSNLAADDMVKLLKVYRNQGSYDKNNIYLQRVIEANMKILKEVSEMSTAELYSAFKELSWFDELEKVTIEKGREEGREEGRMDNAIEIAREMLSDGEAVEKIAKWTKLPVDMIKELEKQTTVQ